MNYKMIIPKILSKGLMRHRPLVRISACTYSKDQNQNPFAKTWDIISKEIPVFFGLNKKPNVYPTHADVVVIGGGFIGSAIAYWLKTRAGEGINVVVLEKDPTYKDTRRNVSLGTLIQHFSLPENILLSQYAAEFLRNAKENINVDIQYCPISHLVLASEKYADKLEYNATIQKEYGVRNELLTADDIKQRYPWINTQDIHLGCIGNESEGYFNSWALLKGLIDKSLELGANYVNAEVTGFELEQQHDVLMEGVAPGSFKKINKVLYKTHSGEEYAIKFAACILAAGDKSAEVARLAKVGTGDGLLKIPLPIEQREEKVYSIECNAKRTGLNTPLITDTSGLWLRNDGLENYLLCGHVPLSTVNPNDCADDEYYQNIVKPSLLNRICDGQNAKVKSVTTESYDYNVYDESGILGPHPYHNNFYIAAGFGKHGCQNAPGIGRAITELIIDSHFTTIDCTRLTFDRLLTDHPMVETNVY